MALAKPRTGFEPLRLRLPEQAGLAGIEIFAELTRQLQGFARSGGTLDRRAQARKLELLQHVLRGGKLAEMLRDAADVRAALALWRESAQFAARASFDAAMLQRIRVISPQPPRMVAWQLAQLFVEHYDRLPAWRELGAWLIELLEYLPARPSHEAKIYHQWRRELFGPNGVAAFMLWARKEGKTLPEARRDWNLAETTRFFHVAAWQHYLQPLDKLSIGADAPLLEELQDPAVKTLAFSDGLLLGHHAAMRLMDKVLQAKNTALPENWRRVLLGILDDPRVPRASQRFQTWWARLDRKYVIAMRSWLSQLDLKLFLNILEDVARSLGKQDLLRMFPARKRFLEGLYEQGLMTESRLLLGSQAEKYIREKFDAHALPTFGRLGSSEISLIYLNLGGLHFIEGTHQFQVRLYRDLPIPGLADYELEKFELAAIRKYATDQTVRHGLSPRWQRQLITAVKDLSGILIEPQGVLSKADWQAYQALYRG
jgi:hypothetical protein